MSLRPDKPAEPGTKRLKPGQFFLAFTLVLIIFAGRPGQSGAAGPAELRAAQISVLPGPDWSATLAHFHKLREAGANTVILRVFHNPGDRYHGPLPTDAGTPVAGLYFKSSAGPLVADLLAPAGACARQAGLKIFAWMTTLGADYGKLTQARVRSYDPGNGKLRRESQLMDPAAPETRSLLKTLFRDLAAYQLDGILLQDDLMLRHLQGFRERAGRIEPDPRGLYQFTDENPGKITGYQPAFSRWRRQQAALLGGLAEDIFASARAVRPRLKLAVNLHYEFLLKPEWSLNWFACSEESRKHSSADYLMIMSYQERMARELELDEAGLNATLVSVCEKARRQPFAEKIVFKFEQPVTDPDDSLRRSLDLARNQGWRNLVVYPCNDPGKIDRHLFSNHPSSVKTENLLDNQGG